MGRVLKVSDVRAEREEGTLILYLRQEEGADLPEGAMPSLSLDVLYGEEDDAPYLLLNVEVGEVEVVAEIPYGEAWDVLREGKQIVLVLPKGEDPEDWPMLVLGINDFLRGAVFGAGRLWEEVSQTYD